MNSLTLAYNNPQHSYNSEILDFYRNKKHNITVLKNSFKRIFSSFKQLGSVEITSYNNGSSFTKKGYFSSIFINDQIGLSIGSIQAKALFNNWKYGFSLKQIKAGREQLSFHFFSTHGKQVLSITLLDSNKRDFFFYLTRQYKRNNQQITTPNTPSNNSINIHNSIKREDLILDWENLAQNHDFDFLLNKYNLKRHQAFEYVGKKYCKRISINDATQLLHKIASNQIPTMIIYQNDGIIQIHQGKVERLKNAKQLLIIKDRQFNLSINCKKDAFAWIVKKPREEGGSTISLEFFDENKNLIVQIFGYQQQDTSKNWSDIVNLN